MIPNLQKILKEWSYRVGVIKPKDKKHLHQLNNILQEEGWSRQVINELIQNLNELAFDIKGVQKYYKDNSKEIFKYGNDWIKKYIQQFKKNDLDTSVIQKGSNAPKIKKGNPNRIEFVLQISNIGRDSRDLAFDAAKLLKGDFLTKFTSSRIQSSAGSVVHTPRKHKDLEIWIAFKGGKSSKTAGSITTEMKEGMVGLFFQSKWKSPVTKTNIGDCITTIKKELPSIKGENNSVKKSLENWLLTVPTSNPKKGFLDELNDPLSIALKLKSTYSSWKWERDSNFEKVRKKASQICKVPADKWNPSDAYLVKGTLKNEGGPGDNITTQIAPINNQFVNSWGATDGIAVGVSLKQASAQAGKGKTYLKSFNEMTKQFDYNLTKNERLKLDVSDEQWVGAYIEQIQDWRGEIKSALSGLSIKYNYTHGGSLFDAAAEDFSKKLVEFTYQKYASIKMFKFMVNALKNNENIFVDSAAFASGLTGYSPTFFKAKGNKSGSGAKIETFEGNGGLELVGNQIKITDTNSNAGVTFFFEVKNNTMGKAKVTMNIRFNGTTQATLELLDVKWS
jgi:hypothetical protein